MESSCVMSCSEAVTVIIQSRMASTRLPAKALLPIAGVPALLLCARRCGNSGLRVLVATSDESADDPIADLTAASGLACVRGSHEDVLGRFEQATRNLPDVATVIRLTADNVFPDGGFLDGLLREFGRDETDYLGTGSPHDGLPYGMSAEIFKVRALRQAHGHATAQFDREHVTPWIIRNCASRRYRHPHSEIHWSRLRCTLDNLDDYLRLLGAFAGVPDPVGASWVELVERLAANTGEGTAARVPFKSRPDGGIRSVITLGTAQWGMPYGIANQTGVPSDAQIKALLAKASDAGVTAIDTARAYGDAEARLGRLMSLGDRDRLSIVTKLDPLAELPVDAAPGVVRTAVDASVFRSAHALRNGRIDVLLLHRWAHRRSWAGVVWERLRELQATNVIGVLGASVSTPLEATDALQDPHVGHLQCPINMLDWRWRGDDFLAAANARPDVVIDARSVLLQGLLMLPAERWMAATGFDATALCGVLDQLAHDLDRSDRAQLSVAYVRALPWVGSLVLGVETLGQLQRHLAALKSPPLSAQEVRLVDARVPRLPETVLNPALWSSRNG